MDAEVAALLRVPFSPFGEKKNGKINGEERTMLPGYPWESPFGGELGLGVPSLPPKPVKKFDTFSSKFSKKRKNSL